MKQSLWAFILFVIFTAFMPVLTFAEVPQSQNEIKLSFAPLVKKTVPSVVNVYAARQVRVRTPFENDPFFEQFFGRAMPNRPSRTQSSLGSGVIVDASGLIVTNYHVIRDADEIKVALSDGREFESRVVLKDEATDIAVLKIEPKGAVFPILPLGNSDSVEVGDLVLAIGNPFGVGQTVTSGIVSAQARTRVGISNFDFFIQTDAAINPGNSGGALIDMKGELIGINTAIYSRSGGSIGIGFAIPANLVRAVVESVKRGEDHFQTPYIGASFQNMTPDVAEVLGMEKPYGAMVTDIIDGSPAQKAGLKIGDVILSAQNTKIDDPDGLGYRLMTTGIGHDLNIEYLRDGKKYTTVITLSAIPQDQMSKSVKLDGDTPFAGVTVIDLAPYMTNRFRLPPKAIGVVVENVDRNSNAARLFQSGDIIRVINGAEVRTVEDLQAILTEIRPRIWQVVYERNGMLLRQFVR
ncbi:DegQ family serine endoprotease [Bartonella tamiae]|uniref:Protease Do n=1 Tax=Bartonella tamiae Th239 TaxID=1094558 RepID=J1JWL1_9HYPH|nr:DegQ family serine endoprotease [Bartonella tamiae]EJF88960.1 protease Do [Bartonella tamiae Th239]EJF94790.1 protease Do [Bartonella tamiae Th307]